MRDLWFMAGLWKLAAVPASKAAENPAACTWNYSVLISNFCIWIPLSVPAIAEFKRLIGQDAGFLAPKSKCPRKADG